MRAGGAPVSVCIRDLSPRSMLLEGRAPAPGTFIEILGPAGSIAGQVIWAKDERFGVRTRERINVKATAAELRSLRLTAEPLADAPGAKSRPSAAGTGLDLNAQAERNRLLGRRIEHLAIAACVAVAAAVVAGAAYYTLARPFAALAAGTLPQR